MKNSYFAKKLLSSLLTILITLTPAFTGNSKTADAYCNAPLPAGVRLPDSASEKNSIPALARISDNETVLYSDPGCTIAGFVLPYGYFVKVLAVNETSVYVRYMDGYSDLPARDGYILTKHYYAFYDDAPEQLYPECKLTLSADEVLFSDSKAASPKTVLPESNKCTFYGYTYVDGERYYCVYSCGYIGYVRAAAFTDQTIPAHPLPFPQKTAETSETDENRNSAKQTTPYSTDRDSVIKTVIVLAVSVVALSVVYLLFKPDRKHRFAFTDKDSDDLM